MRQRRNRRPKWWRGQRRPGSAIQAPPQLADPAASLLAPGDLSDLVEIGGRETYSMGRVEGGPTLILEAGSGNGADIWDTIALGPDSGETAVR